MYVPANMTAEEEEDGEEGRGEGGRSDAEQSVWKGFSGKLL